MGQIKTVFPEAYTFRQEKNIPSFSSSIKKGSYQLTVEPVIASGENTIFSSHLSVSQLGPVHNSIKISLIYVFMYVCILWVWLQSPFIGSYDICDGPLY